MSNIKCRKCGKLGECTPDRAEDEKFLSSISQANERWRRVPNFEDYLVSSFGRVVSIKCGSRKIRKLCKHKRDGYLALHLCSGNKTKRFTAHRLVMLAFVGASKKIVNHKNGIKTDNRLENLEYCTSAANNKHAREMGLTNIDGENHGNSKLTNEQVKYIIASDLPCKELAEKFNVTACNIQYIKRGNGWRCVRED